MCYNIRPHFAEVEIHVWYTRVSQPILHAGFKDIVQEQNAMIIKVE